MSAKCIALLACLVASASYSGVPNLDDNFDGYSPGTVFVSSINNWQASSSNAYVTNSSAAYLNNAVIMEDTVALSNTLNADSSLIVWTHLRVNPMLGAEPLIPPTNGPSFVSYFNNNGYLVVYVPGGTTLVCSNDVWGNVVLPATNSAVDKGYVQMSVWQNYTTRTQALFLRGQLVVQDLGFSGSAVSNSQLVIQNTDSNCWVDTVWVKTNYDATALVADNNGVYGVDANELNVYGYVARRLYVSSTQTNLANCFPTISNALAAWRPRDTVHVLSGNYASETIVLAANASNVVFEGDAFTISSLTVSTGASATFSQSVTCSGELSISGQVAMAQSSVLSSAVATVSGSLAIASNATFTVGGALTVGTNGRIDFTNNAHFVAGTAGVEMNGTFTISNTWTLAGSQLIRMPLPFSDNFDTYGTGVAVSNLKFRGWYASGGGVTIQGIAQSGKGVELPDGAVLSNSISSIDSKIWTDYQIRPFWGGGPLVPLTNASSFLSYVNSDGFLVVYGDEQGWVVCSNKLDAVHSPVNPLASNEFTRVTVCQDLDSGKFAVFIAGNLVAQGLSSPVKLNAYASLVVDNQDGAAYLDDIVIAASIPDGLSTDLDGDGTPDAWEIHNFGLTTAWPVGSVYIFR